MLKATAAFACVGWVGTRKLFYWRYKSSIISFQCQTARESFSLLLIILGVDSNHLCDQGEGDSDQGNASCPVYS